MANNVDPDVTANYEPSHLNLQCLQRYLYCSAWLKGLKTSELTRTNNNTTNITTTKKKKKTTTAKQAVNNYLNRIVKLIKNKMAYGNGVYLVCRCSVTSFRPVRCFRAHAQTEPDTGWHKVCEKYHPFLSQMTTCFIDWAARIIRTLI